MEDFEKEEIKKPVFLFENKQFYVHVIYKNGNPTIEYEIVTWKIYFKTRRFSSLPEAIDYFNSK